MPQITKRERLEAAIAGEVADRLPVALWRHFPVDDQNPEWLAAACLAFQREYDFDFLKITPASSYCLKDWGIQDEWRGNTEGTRQYTRRIIADPDEWKGLAPLDPEGGALGDQLHCIELISRNSDGSLPYMPTIFSPLAQAKNLAGGERLLEHLRQHPQEVLRGLEVITQSTVHFIEAARARGIAGVFYAIQHASRKLLDEESYARFGTPFDRRILEAVHRSLRPGGRFLLELNHGPGLWAGYLPSSVSRRNADLMTDEYHYDALTGRSHCHRTVVRDGCVRSFRFSNRIFSYPELRDWMSQTGFREVEAFGKGGAPLTQYDRRMIVRAVR